jgi:uncharacterized protein
MPWDFALILLFLATAVPFLGRRRIRQLMRMPQTSKADRLALYRSTVASQWIAAALIFWRARAHRIAASSLGLAIGEPAVILATAVLLSALVLANQLVSLRRLLREPTATGAILPEIALKVFPHDKSERVAFFAVVLTVSICEEFIFRGFAQHVIEKAAHGRVWIGILGSAVLFAVAHLYQGRRGLIATLVVGTLFSAVRSWTGSLLPPMAAHFTADLTAGFLTRSRLALAPSAGGQDKSSID